jgi:hypothetical protein
MTAAPDLGSYPWRKSTRSVAAGECVEVAFLPEAVAVRDSKDPDGPMLRVDARTWREFVAFLRNDS